MHMILNVDMDMHVIEWNVTMKEVEDEHECGHEHTHDQ